MSRQKVVLVGVVGMSPAVLTETVWALAQESPPIIPDEVVAITTTDGRNQILERLFGRDAVWESLRKALAVGEDRLRFGADSSIQVIGDGNRNFSDISSPKENEAAADFMLRLLRQYTDDSNTTVIASIAGGRKTMSALMMACMSLLGCEQDRVCHVLANDAFIAQHKDFFFPRNEEEQTLAGIQLSDIPFIRVRGWYEQESGKAPASYGYMVSLFRQAAPMAIVEEKVLFDCKAKQLVIGNETIDPSASEFDAALLFVQDRMKGKYSSIQNLLPIKHTVLKDDDTFRKCLHRVREKIKKAGFELLSDRLLPSAKERNYLYRNIQIRPGRPRTSD
jgi:CRISPR-associated protein (TIGR02584 family)